MTVAELVQALQGMDQSLPVVMEDWLHSYPVEVKSAIVALKFLRDSPGERSVVVIA